MPQFKIPQLTTPSIAKLALWQHKPMTPVNAAPTYSAPTVEPQASPTLGQKISALQDRLLDRQDLGHKIPFEADALELKARGADARLIRVHKEELTGAVHVRSHDLALKLASGEPALNHGAPLAIGDQAKAHRIIGAVVSYLHRAA